MRIGFSLNKKGVSFNYRRIAELTGCVLFP
jgi:hypothetical protein